MMDLVDMLKYIDRGIYPPVYGRLPACRKTANSELRHLQDNHNQMRVDDRAMELTRRTIGGVS